MFSCVNIVEFVGLYLRVLKLYRSIKLSTYSLLIQGYYFFAAFKKSLGLGFIAGL